MSFVVTSNEGNLRHTTSVLIINLILCEELAVFGSDNVAVLDALLYLELTRIELDALNELNHSQVHSMWQDNADLNKEIMVKEPFRKSSLTELVFRMSDMSIVWKLRTSMFTP